MRHKILPKMSRQILIQTRRPKIVVAGLVVALVAAVGGYVAVHSSLAAVSGDLNGDGTVNVFDLSILLSNWGTSDATADINRDGTVNIFDLSTLLSHWGQTGPTPTPTPSTSASPTPTPSSSPTSYSCVSV